MTSIAREMLILKHKLVSKILGKFIGKLEYFSLLKKIVEK